MVSDAELDRWNDQPQEINLAAVREVCRELLKRRELDAEVMIKSKRGDTRGIEWCQCPVCEHEQWLTRCNYCHADIPHSLIELQAENERLREALR